MSEPEFVDEELTHEAAVRALNREAFGRDDEARLVDTLRAGGAAQLSLVAIVRGAVVGHIFFSPVTVGDVTGAGLAPMAVLPAYQKRGIGGRLIEVSLGRLRGLGCPFVVVLGHPGFYRRFGFKTAADLGVRCEWTVPEDAFMIQFLRPGVAGTVRGRARYRPEFNAVGPDS